MNNWTLPTSLTISGVAWQIRTDYRAIIDIMIVFNSAEYEADEKWLIALNILFIDFEKMPKEDYVEACKQATWFFDLGQTEDDNNGHIAKNKTKLMDWEQDANLIIPAINRVIGKEVRSLEYMHWWTFMGAYMEIGECAYSTVISIRSKRAKGKKLEKWEQEYLTQNKSIVELYHKKTDEELEEERRLIELFG